MPKTAELKFKMQVRIQVQIDDHEPVTYKGNARTSDSIHITGDRIIDEIADEIDATLYDNFSICFNDLANEEIDVIATQIATALAPLINEVRAEPEQEIEPSGSKVTMSIMDKLLKEVYGPEMAKQLNDDVIAELTGVHEISKGPQPPKASLHYHSQSIDTTNSESGKKTLTGIIAGLAYKPNVVAVGGTGNQVKVTGHTHGDLWCPGEICSSSCGIHKNLPNKDYGFKIVTDPDVPKGQMWIIPGT